MLDVDVEESDEYNGNNVNVISPRQGQAEYRSAALLLIQSLNHHATAIYP